MNNVQRGSLRDREVVALVKRLGVVNTDQVRQLLFPFASGLRKAQQRLTALVERGRLNRCRLSSNEPYIYYVGRRSGQLDHAITVSWAYCHITAALASWERLDEWRLEEVCGDLRSDAVAGIRIVPTGEWRYVMVEADCSDNPFDKVGLYNNLFESQAYLGAWWAETARRFPSILIVTHSQARKHSIVERIKRENVNGLRWETVTVGEVEGNVGGHRVGAGSGRGAGGLSVNPLAAGSRA